LSSRPAYAALIFVEPGIEVKAIEADALFADRHLDQIRAHVGIETVLVHPQVAWSVAVAD